MSECQTIFVDVMGVRGKSQRCDPAYFDIETKKVEVEAFKRANGEVVRWRWEPIAMGLGWFDRNGAAVFMLSFGWDNWVEWLRGFDATHLVYGATREFDEMVCKGRFHNARRKHFAHKTFPGVAEDRFEWTNIKKESKPHPLRGKDVESKRVPAIWKTPGLEADLSYNQTLVLVHLLRDVVELMMRDPAVTVKHPAKLKRIMEDFSYAAKLVNESR